ncbi:MAG: protein kinase [Nitriliruptorales bacterium]|nr:protein kinase [Nitriliruptorales bacterium]
MRGCSPGWRRRSASSPTSTPSGRCGPNWTYTPGCRRRCSGPPAAPRHGGQGHRGGDRRRGMVAASWGSGLFERAPRFPRFPRRGNRARSFRPSETDCAAAGCLVLRTRPVPAAISCFNGAPRGTLREVEPTAGIRPSFVIARRNGGKGEGVIDVSTHIAGRYRVDARLGGGGMADVFAAYDEVLHRPVAVKILRGIDDPVAARRFAEEIRLTARVNHPNIVRLFNAGEHDGSPYLVLERVTGGTLAGEMAAGTIDPRRLAVIGEQVASALSHSHAAGIIHRDVKPTNVLLAGDGNVRLADFGIAITATATRLTLAGSVAGSAGYVSPEQVLGSGAGPASDVYSLGLVLLECLVGAPPWSGTTVEVALARLSSDPVIPQTLPDGWTPLLRAMTARTPEIRPSIETVGLALSQLAAGEIPDARMFATGTDAPQADRRVPAVAGMSTLLLLFSALLVLSSQSQPDAAIADATSLSNLSAASARFSPVAAERTALATASAQDDAARKQRRAAQRRARASAGDGATGDSAAAATTAPDEPSLTEKVTQTTSDVTGTAGAVIDSTAGTLKVSEPEVTAPSSPTVEDPIDTVKDAAQTLNKDKDKAKPTLPGKAPLPGAGNDG